MDGQALAVFSMVSGIEFELGAKGQRKQIHQHIHALCVALCPTNQLVQLPAQHRNPSFQFTAPHFPTTCLLTGSAPYTPYASVS